LLSKIGGLAHLARALAWQARGDRFESGILHKSSTYLVLLFFDPFYKNIKKALQFLQGFFL
jgi:hypothetical protein